VHAWAADRRGRGPVGAVASHVADDVAYGTGVWVGCAREHTLVPLVPRIAWRSRVWSAPNLRDQLQRPVPPTPEPPMPSAQAEKG
jgi:hypothetical protein